MAERVNINSVEALAAALPVIREAQNEYATFNQEQVDAICEAAAMAASMLTACGSNDAGTGSSTGSTGSSSTATTTADGLVNINVTRACFQTFHSLLGSFIIT